MLSLHGHVAGTKIMLYYDKKVKLGCCVYLSSLAYIVVVLYPQSIAFLPLSVHTL